jgi:predicted mannosyl-3-phosphoglycerate phosphatase (HAD superfamily)
VPFFWALFLFLIFAKLKKEQMLNNKKIAVDFDGTIVDDAYPAIGKPKFAFETLKRLQAEGYRLILWTYRHGKTLDEAVEFCKKNGVEFYAVNSSFEGEVFDSEINQENWMQTGSLMTEIWRISWMGRNLQYYSGKNRIP